jgi:nicotinamide riboside kinase
MLGAESTGKSTLASALRHELERAGIDAVAVLPELLRQFFLAHNRPPSAAEQAGLMQAQVLAEANASMHSAIVLTDSPPLATALYSDLHYRDDSLYPAALAHQHNYDLVVVTWPDFPWQDDPHPGMRDGPVMQALFHRRLLERLQQDQLPHLIVRGEQMERSKLALEAILALIR